MRVRASALGDVSGRREVYTGSGAVRWTEADRGSRMAEPLQGDPSWEFRVDVMIRIRTASLEPQM